jgi:hypothetical protein
VDLSAPLTLLAGIRERDYEAIRSCLAPDAELRALTPHQLRDEVGADAVVAQYRYWLDPLERFEVLAADAERVADRVRVRYRFRGRDREHGWQENEHTAYVALDGGRISALNLSCAGFRPAAEPAERVI